MAGAAAESGAKAATTTSSDNAGQQPGALTVHEPAVIRTPLLANSAAEFIENRIESSLGSHLSPAGNAHEFVAEFDAFVPKENVPSREKYFEQSKLQLAQFQKTLASFQALLKDRNLERELDLPVKSPDKYTAQDVLQVAQKVAAKHKGKARHNDVLGHIRKGFRAVGQSSVIERLVDFAPTDVYGSVIYGSFTLILGAIERCETLRDSIYAALAEIPDKLERVRDLAQLHYKSAELWNRANWVFVSVFALLEKIIGELTKGIAKKSFTALIKGKKYGSDVEDAMQDFEKNLVKFRDQSDLDNQHRLGRVEEKVDAYAKQSLHLQLEIKASQDRLAKYMEQKAALESRQGASSESQARIEKLDAEIDEEAPVARILNRVYSLLTASGKFDARGGGLLAAPPVSKTETLRIAREWLKKYPVAFHRVSTLDLQEHLRRMPERDDEDRIKWILTSQAVLDFLTSKKSTNLLIQCETAPDSFENSLSFSTAFIAQTLRQTYQSPVLYHSCGMRSLQGTGEGLSDALSVINSLNAQLIRHMPRIKDSPPDLTFLEDKTFRRQAQSKLRKAIALFERLVSLLPEQSMVFIIIEGLSRLTGGDLESDDKVISAVCGLSQLDALRVKVLLSDAMPGSAVLHDRQVTQLFVPDNVYGDGQGLNLVVLREDAKESFSRHIELVEDSERESDAASGD